MYPCRSVAVVMTASGTNDDGSVSADVTTWWTKPAFGGMTLSFGISLSPGKTISINDSRVSKILPSKT